MNTPPKRVGPTTALLNNLTRLQEIEMLARPNAEARTERDKLRQAIPEPMLAHYDRLMARRKKGIVVVRNNTCTGCHLRLPMGVIMTLKQAEDVQLCENCGRYLLLPEEPEPPAPVARRKRTPGAPRRPRPAGS